MLQDLPEVSRPEKMSLELKKGKIKRKHISQKWEIKHSLERYYEKTKKTKKNNVFVVTKLLRRLPDIHGKRSQIVLCWKCQFHLPKETVHRNE